MVGCSWRWGLEFKENAWLDTLGVVTGPENAWNLGGREGVRKEEVRVSALGQPTERRTSARRSRLRRRTRAGGFVGAGRGLVGNVNSHAVPIPDLRNQGLQGCGPGGCVLTSPPGNSDLKLEFENH